MCHSLIRLLLCILCCWLASHILNSRHFKTCLKIFEGSDSTEWSWRIKTCEMSMSWHFPTPDKALTSWATVGLLQNAVAKKGKISHHNWEKHMRIWHLRDSHFDSSCTFNLSFLDFQEFALRTTSTEMGALKILKRQVHSLSISCGTALYTSIMLLWV